MTDVPEANTTAEKIERVLERGLFASRWLMAPFYVGLMIGLLALMVVFVRDLVGFIIKVPTAKEADVILGILTLVDLSLAGNLVIMVVFSGYENFVSKMEHVTQKDRPEWMGSIDFSALKLKLLASIVAISAIHLLKGFMNIGAMSDREMMWLVVIHVTFVVSGVFLALTDRLSGSSK
ncbi:MAG: TIGR00645 family protein [Phreatobacter sp.]|uniref:TIGR00645 family protein n=1 Tax=Phreatobacter sp. TaxID=1966341 RepID=UPI002736E86E|nr:TIGR00645 family protein [Phreatobacter sp.]MDP2803533.1 TIGR00645 family protein [Phreatobacter sp.]